MVIKQSLVYPSRGITNGSSFPYMFLICLKRLSHIIRNQVDATYCKSIRADMYGLFQFLTYVLLMTFFLLQRPPPLSRLVVSCIALISFAKLLSKKLIDKKLGGIFPRMLTTSYEGTLFSIQVLAKLTISPLKWIVRIIWLSYEGNFF